MPISLSYDEFFKRAQPERVGEDDARAPPPAARASKRRRVD